MAGDLQLRFQAAIQTRVAVPPSSSPSFGNASGSAQGGSNTGWSAGGYNSSSAPGGSNAGWASGGYGMQRSSGSGYSPSSQGSSYAGNSTGAYGNSSMTFAGTAIRRMDANTWIAAVTGRIKRVPAVIAQKGSQAFAALRQIANDPASAAAALKSQLRRQPPVAAQPTWMA